MQHFTQLDQNNNVIYVCPIDDKKCLDKNGNISEEVGIKYCKSFYGQNTIWKQTCYDGSFRVRYAAIGYFYSEELDAFLYPKPYLSWILNTETYEWDPPVPKPELTEEQIESGNYYEWNEENIEWELKTMS
jgi:hypothetical protein